MKPYKRIFTIVIDSMGIGDGPDAERFDDLGSDTLGHIDDHMPEFDIPNMAKLGIARLHPVSYTHLDVYKRQCGYGAMRLRGQCRVGGNAGLSDRNRLALQAFAGYEGNG